MKREDIIRMADAQGLVDYFDLDGDSVGQLMLYTLVLDCIADEREACAKVCYELPWKDFGHLPSNLEFAAAIRARSNT